MHKIFVDWETYIEYLDKMAEKAREYDAEIVIGLTRGGLVPSVYLSHALRRPMITFNPHVLHLSGLERDRVHLPISPDIVKRILIVDDISDTGKTFHKCTKFFDNRGFKCFTISVFSNEMTTIASPNYFCKDSEKRWVVFPYEKE